MKPLTDITMAMCEKKHGYWNINDSPGCPVCMNESYALKPVEAVGELIKMIEGYQTYWKDAPGYDSVSVENHANMQTIFKMALASISLREELAATVDILKQTRAERDRLTAQVAALEAELKEIKYG